MCHNGDADVEFKTITCAFTTLVHFFPAPFDHFHFHPTLGLYPALILTLRHIIITFT